MAIKILNDDRQRTGWITAIVNGHQIEAKVYDEPSTYGINDGRVSKLTILKTATRDRNKEYLKQACYNYDRGLDFDNAPAGLLDAVVKFCESLPPTE